MVIDKVGCGGGVYPFPPPPLIGSDLTGVGIIDYFACFLLYTVSVESEALAVGCV
jgi:hypothetical protein